MKNTDVNALRVQCEESFYKELYQFDEGRKSLVIHEVSGKIYIRKSLETYNLEVFRFLKEHENIHLPKTHSFREEDGRLIVLEEYIQGETLEYALRERSLSHEQKRQILKGVCEGIRFLHEAVPPVIHRDIKPANIILEGWGNVRIIDFDAARVFCEGAGQDTVLIGTVGIAAPEQYGFGSSDERTDIYALGKLMIRLFGEDSEYRDVITHTSHTPKGFHI